MAHFAQIDENNILINGQSAGLVTFISSTQISFTASTSTSPSQGNNGGLGWFQDGNGAGGGGSGSVGAAAGGTGGSGVVIITYLSPIQRATGGTVTSTASGTQFTWVHTFTGSGVFSA